MSREILRFGRSGIVTRTDGVCWQVHVSPNGNSIVGHDRVQDGFPFYAPSCKTSRLNDAANQLGGISLPGRSNGFTPLCELAADANGPTRMLVQDTIYNGDTWLAERTGFGWKASITDQRCQVNAPTPQPQPTPQAQQQASTTPLGQDFNPILVAGIGLVVIGIVIAVTK